jgi:GMP synthase (glutamine-hydrolysing)
LIVPMKKLLIITHDESDGFGTLEAFLRCQRFSINTVKFCEGEMPPAKARQFAAIVTIGKSMGAQDKNRYLFLRKEAELLEQAMESNIPILGVCLGAQMIARACGVSTVKATGQDIGWKNVFVTNEGKRDILFQGLPNVLKVFHCHEETFEIPHGGLLLATSSGCPHQAFRYGNAYGLQFHVEITSEILMEWFNGKPELPEYVDIYRGIERDFFIQAKMIYSNFMWLVDLCCQSSGIRGSADNFIKTT